MTFLRIARRNGYDAERRSFKDKFRVGMDIMRYPKNGSPKTSHWFWEDAWFGSNPFSGVTTVWYKGRACYQNHYWGYVMPTKDHEKVYAFLRWARRQTWKKQSIHSVSSKGLFAGLKYHVLIKNLAKSFASSKKYEKITKDGRTICEVFETKGIVI